VDEFTGKQVPEGGEYCNTALLQQVSTAVAVNVTGTHGSHVSTMMFEHWMERQGLPATGPYTCPLYIADPIWSVAGTVP
jgi:hypothetical protein